MSAPLMPPPPPLHPDVRPANVPHPLPFEKYRKFTDDDLKPILDGEAWAPNFEPLPLEKVLPHIIDGYGHTYHRQRFKVDRHRYGGPSAIYFLKVGQGGGLTGEGVVLYREGWAEAVDKFKGGSFAICVHEAVEKPGANHQRGWHPAECKHCGIDLSVDSGD